MPRKASCAGASKRPQRPAADPATEAVFAEAFDAATAGATALAVAHSGGPDSTALLHLTLRRTAKTGVAVTALTVDHGLRPESAGEAGLAAARAREMGAEAVILQITTPLPETGIQNAARRARYGLMCDWRRAQGVDLLLTGHHLDDQAATVLMRIGRGSGIDGLAAMQPLSARDGLRLARPLLALRKRQLLAWLQAHELPWIDDQSNESARFERNRLNALLAAHDADGHLSERLARLAQRSARAREALEHMAAQEWTRLAEPEGAGRHGFDGAEWRRLPRETGLRLIARAIEAAAGTPPGLSVLEDALARLPTQGRVNLAGAILALKDGRISVGPEPRRR